MSQFRRIVVITDSHGDSQDEYAIEAMLRFCDTFKPDIRIHLGDVFDFRPLRKKADENEKSQSLLSDYEAGKNLLELFQPTHLLRGNHDERLWDLARDGSGIQRDFASRAVGDLEQFLADLHCTVLPYNKRYGFLQIGDVGFIHGYAHGQSAIKQNITAYGSRVRCIIQGHTHTAEHFSSPSVDDQEGYVCPCLCKLEMEYNRCSLGTLKHRHGWMYGVIHEKTGRYEMWVAKGFEGRYLLPTGLEEF